MNNESGAAQTGDSEADSGCFRTDRCVDGYRAADTPNAAVWQARHESEMAALKAHIELDEEVPVGFAYRRSVGDLVVEMMAPGLGSWNDNAEHPEGWKSLECMFLENIALELRILNHAMAADRTPDEPPGDEVTHEDTCRAIQLLSRRVAAGAELSRRLREARWGNPHFGGGEVAAQAATVAAGASRKAGGQ